jgi:hypothetical protein
MNRDAARMSNLDYLRRILSGSFTPTDKSRSISLFPL